TQKSAPKKPAAFAPSGAAAKSITMQRPLPASFDATNRIPRRVPVPTLRPPLDLCKPTGATLEAGRRVILMPDKAGVADALTERLKTLGVEVLRIVLDHDLTNDQTLAADALVNQLKALLAAGPVHGIYWLPALDTEGDLTAMNVPSW